MFGYHQSFSNHVTCLYIEHIILYITQFYNDKLTDLRVWEHFQTRTQTQLLYLTRTRKKAPKVAHTQQIKSGTQSISPTISPQRNRPTVILLQKVPKTIPSQQLGYYNDPNSQPLHVSKGWIASNPNHTTHYTHIHTKVRSSASMNRFAPVRITLFLRGFNRHIKRVLRTFSRILFYRNF